MRKQYKFNKCEYNITKNQGEELKGYGYNLKIYKNNKLDYSPTIGFPDKSQAYHYFEKYMIENQFNLELD